MVDRVCRATGEAYAVDDVDADPHRTARYGDLVPVLFVDGAEVARWRVDEAELRRALAAGSPGAR